MAVMDLSYFDTSIHGDKMEFVNEDPLLDSLYQMNDYTSQVYQFDGNMETNLDFWDGSSTSDVVDPRQTFNSSLPLDNGLDIDLFSQQPSSYPLPVQSTTMPPTSLDTSISESSRTIRKHKASNNDPQPDDDTLKSAPKKRRSRKRKPAPTPAEAEAKRQNFLRRNRAAAAKCRQKNREKVNGIQEKKIALETEHKILLMELDQTREQVDTLRKLVLMHADCKHPNVAKWIMEGGDLNQLAPQRPGLDPNMFHNPAEPTEEDGERSSRSGSVESTMGEDGARERPSVSSVSSVSTAYNGSDSRRPSVAKVKQQLPSPPDSAIDVSSPKTRTVERMGGGVVQQTVKFEALTKEFQHMQQFSRPVGW